MVTVRVDQSTNVAVSITIQQDQVGAAGEITGVDLVSQTLTMETEDNRVLHLRFLILEGDIKIIIEGGEGSLFDVVRRASVRISYNPETMVITTIYIHTGTGG